MHASDIPTKLPIPFAANAGVSYIRSIPTASQIGITAGTASLNDGFTPDTFVNTGSGGSNVDGRDMNGILFEISAWSRWQAAGGLSVYDSTFSTAIGGYPKGAILASSATPGVVWICTADSNTTDPDGGSAANWSQFVITTVDNTFTGKQSFAGSASKFAALFTNASEVVDYHSGGASGTLNFYLNTSSVRVENGNASGNWTLNIAFSSGTSLNTAMGVNQSVTLAHLVRQGSTAYYASTIQIDGTALTSGTNIFWQGGAAPAAGNPTGFDLYTFHIIKTGTNAYLVFASLVQF